MRTRVLGGIAGSNDTSRSRFLESLKSRDREVNECDGVGHRALRLAHTGVCWLW
jgi:hypothetical protein